MTTARFHELNCKCKLFVPKGRINFESGLGKQGKSPAFGSVVIKLDDVDSIEYIDLSTAKRNAEINDIETVSGVTNSTTIITKKSWYT